MNVFYKKLFISNIIFITNILFFNAAFALDIIIDKGVENPIPVAIVPFGWSQASSIAPIDLASIISDDLERSARFAPMDQKDLPQRPYEYQNINFKDWQLLGMENLVIGKLSLDENGNYIDTYFLVMGNEPDAGRASANLALDFFTLGLWEIVATPMEMASTRESFSTLIIYYDSEEKIKEFKQIGTSNEEDLINQIDSNNKQFELLVGGNIEKN